GEVVAECGGSGAAGPHYDLLAYASWVVLVTRAALEEVVRLRERVAAVTAALALRHRQGIPVSVVVVADHRRFHVAVTETGQALGPGDAARVIGGLPYAPKSAGARGREPDGRPGRALVARAAPAPERPP